MSEVDQFIFHSLPTVRGYLDPPDALVFKAIIENQNEARLGGGLVEIGVFYGRSYFLLRKLSDDRDRVLAIDLFDIDENDDQHSTQLDIFRQNGVRLSLPVEDDLLIAGDSTKLDPGDILEKVGLVRFFSIDGGHMLEHVKADSGLAIQSLAEHGVIAFDDTFNPQWPEVTVGVSDFLRLHHEELTPFCMTKYKTYVCRRDCVAFYQDAIATSPGLNAFSKVETTMFGDRIIRLETPVARRLAYEASSRLRLRALSRWAYRH